jgi:hypothetical protein
MPRPPKCHTCDLFPLNMPRDWMCARAVCTNPLSSPTNKRATYLMGRRRHNHRLAASGYFRRWGRRHRAELNAKSREYTRHHRSHKRAYNKHYYANQKNRLRINRRRAVLYAGNTDVQRKSRHRASTYAQQKKAEGWVRRQCKDGAVRWIPPTDSRHDIPWRTWARMTLNQQLPPISPQCDTAPALIHRG